MREVETQFSVITDSGVFISGDQPDNAFAVNLLYGVYPYTCRCFYMCFLSGFLSKHDKS